MCGEVLFLAASAALVDEHRQQPERVVPDSNRPEKQAAPAC